MGVPLLEAAATRADALAVDDTVRTRTWGELLDRAAGIAHWWRDGLGLASGDHVAMVMGNRVEFVELALAAVLSGVWMTPVNWHLTADEIAFILDDSGARVVVVDPTFAETTRAAVAGIERPITLVVAGDELDAVIAAAGRRPVDERAPAGGQMLYTSGTTGRPKGVKRALTPTVRHSLVTAPSAASHLGLDGNGPHLVTGPLYHAAPGGFGLLDLFNGASLVLMPSWDAAETLRLIGERGIRNTHLVPTMFVRLLRLPDDVRAAFDPSGLHVVLHGAAPIAPAVKQRMIEWWGDVIVEYWGGSEGGVVTLVGADEWLGHPGTVGRALPSYEVFAVDDERRPLPSGETGALYCRNLLTTKVFEYHNDAAKTAAAHLEPGVYTLGDIGRVEDDGYVYLSDRAAHTIISGGVNIYPAEIEQVLIEHPAVLDVAVFGIPDDEWGEQVKAVVQLADGCAPSGELVEDLLAFARTRLAGFKVPRSVDFEAELPRSPAGKLYKQRLKERYAT